MTKAKPKDPTPWELAEFAVAHNNRVLMYGLPGTGKTYFGLTHAIKTTAYRLICTEEMTDADLIGCYKQNDKGTWTFHEGVGIRAWREGARLVVDEINRMNGDVESRMMALIDSHASSSWQHPDTGEVVKPDSKFSVVATMNGEPEDLAPAILDRLTVRIAISQPNPNALLALPEYLRGIATKWTDRDAYPRYSLRSFVDFHAMNTSSANLEMSARVAFGPQWKELNDFLLVNTSKLDNGTER
jgi:hypothetical protein